MTSGTLWLVDGFPIRACFAALDGGGEMKWITPGAVSGDSLLLSLIRVITVLASMIQTKILASGLSLAAYGSYSQATIVVSVGASIILLGLPDAINYFYNHKEKQEDERKQIVNTVFFLEILAGVLLAILIDIGRGGIAAYFSNTALKMLLPWVAIKPMLDNLLYFYQLLYVSAGKARIIAIRNLVMSLLRIAAMYIAVFTLKSIVWIFCLIIAMDVLQLLVLKAYFAKEGFLVQPHKMRKKFIRPILTYGLPMGIYAATNMLAREIDKLVVGYLANTETLAIYANCSKILPFDIISVSFATVLIPHIMHYVSGKDNEKAAKLFSDYLKIGYYSVWILGVAVLITSRQVISLLYAKEFLAGHPVFVIYIFDSMLKFASVHLILTAGGKTTRIMRYSLSTSLLNLGLSVVLYYLCGIIGPAIATLISTAIYTFLILRSSIQTVEAKWTAVIDVKDLMFFGMTIVVTGGAFYCGNQAMLRAGWNMYVSMILSAGGFCLVNLLLHARHISNVIRSINTLR